MVVVVEESAMNSTCNVYMQRVLKENPYLSNVLLTAIFTQRKYKFLVAVTSSDIQVQPVFLRLVVQEVVCYI